MYQVATRARVRERVVVGVRRVPVRDQQTLLVGVVVDQVRAWCWRTRSSTDRSSGTCRTTRRTGDRRCSSCRTAPWSAPRPRSSPRGSSRWRRSRRRRRSTVLPAGRDRDLVDEDAVRDVVVVALRRPVGRVAEPQPDRLAGVARTGRTSPACTPPAVPSIPLPSAGLVIEPGSAVQRRAAVGRGLDVGVVAAVADRSPRCPSAPGTSGWPGRRAASPRGSSCSRGRRRCRCTTAWRRRPVHRAR